MTIHKKRVLSRGLPLTHGASPTRDKTRLIQATSLLAAIVAMLGAGFAPSTARAGGDPGKAPMFGTRDGVWGRMAMSYRIRPELRTNADLDSSADDNSLIGYQRARVGLAMNYHRWLRGFIEFQDAREFGDGNATTAYTANTELHLAWVQLVGPRGTYLKVGKQKLLYGKQRLIGHLEWVNKPRTYDAVKFHWNRPWGWLDVFGAFFTPNDNMLDGTYLTGAYHQLSLVDGNIVWEQYAIGLTDLPGALPAGQTYSSLDNGEPPDYQRNFGTFGTRFAFRNGGFHTELEGAYQSGSASVPDNLKQSAYFAHLDVGFTVDGKMSPSIRAEVDYGSGDKVETTDVVERFNNLFPTNHLHYGYMDLQNLSNTTAASLGFGVKPRKRVTVKLDYWLHARATTDDGWYNAGGKVLAAPDPTSADAAQSSKLLGHEVDVTVKFKVNPHLAFVNGASVFQPVGFGTTRGPDPQFWAYTMLLAKF